MTSMEQLQDIVSGMKKRCRSINSQVKHTEKLIHERKELVTQSENYLKYRPTYKEYKQTNPRKRDDYYNQHTTALVLYQTAERYLKEHLGENTALYPVQWKEEAVELTLQKKKLYHELCGLRAEVQEAEAVKQCVEQMLELQMRRREKVRTGDVSL